MKRLHTILGLIVVLTISSWTLTGCDVHEFPHIPERAPVILRLSYDTDMTEWFHIYDADSEKVIEQSVGETYDNHRASGVIRYTVRAYPLKDGILGEDIQEFVFTKDISEGYDNEVEISLRPGEYRIMVWSDLIEYEHDSYFYNSENFLNITYQGAYCGINDYHDAFRGSKDYFLNITYKETEPDVIDIAMQRPLAKYEFISNDLKDFVTKSMGTANTKSVDLDDYRIVIYYVGFMPSTYSLGTDNVVDSSNGVYFQSTIDQLSETEASIGFDYIFTDEKDDKIAVQIGLFNSEGELISNTSSIVVPINRDYHTIVRGKFLTSETSSGIAIDPNFDDDFNIVL